MVGEPAEAVSPFMLMAVILNVVAGMLAPADNVIPLATSEQIVPV